MWLTVLVDVMDGNVVIDWLPCVAGVCEERGSGQQDDGCAPDGRQQSVSLCKV